MDHRTLGRRRFIGTSMAAGLGALAHWQTLGATARASAPVWFERSFADLQALMRSGDLSSRELTQGYLHRIREVNPLLGAVIETNPTAVAVAARRDAERRRGYVRGPLHGIPILVKDNVATRDMETTAGSLALVGSRVPGDAPIVRRLRRAGAVILGKANLSEWANFRGGPSISGWSARGGFTRNPYLLDWEVCGSSSGSAVAPAVNMCAGAVGTETDGSILCPSGNNLIVGLKPTVGLLPGRGIIPIAASQDTAGPMCRTVSDAAVMLGVMQGHGADYTKALRRGALAGKRVGVDRRYFTFDYGGEPDIVPVVERALETMYRLGATIVDTDTGDPFGYFDAEFTVLLYEFKAQIAEYLATLGHTRMRSLADLIAFNQRRCKAEMTYFGQELFEAAEATSGDLSDPIYTDARALCLQLARTDGIDAAIARDGLDVIVAPSYSYASGPAAVAGYPSMSLPLGLTDQGHPCGVWMYGPAFSERTLLACAYDLEQEVQPRVAPTFAGSPIDYPDAGLCAAPGARAAVSRMAPGAARRRRAGW